MPTEMISAFKDSFRWMRKQSRRHLWSFSPTDSQDFLFRDDSVPYRETSLDGLPGPVVAKLDFYNQGAECRDYLSQSQYLIQWPSPVLIEPEHGWAVVGKWSVAADSIPYKFYAIMPRLGVGLAWLRSRHGVGESPVFSLRDIGEGNYFHCYNDILGKLVLADESGLDADIPGLISARLYDMPFFRELISLGQLRARRWVVQGPRQNVTASQAYFCKVRPCSAKIIAGLLRMIAAPPPEASSQQRILVLRRESSGRGLLNRSEVVALFARYGFKCVELEGMGVVEQMALFRRARHIAAIHGAGLTNIIYRAGASTSVLEIFPPNNVPPHYYWICRQLGFQYTAVIGISTISTEHSWRDFRKIAFSVNMKDLEAGLCRALDA